MGNDAQEGDKKAVRHKTLSEGQQNENISSSHLHFIIYFITLHYLFLLHYIIFTQYCLSHYIDSLYKISSTTFNSDILYIFIYIYGVFIKFNYIYNNT